MNSHESGDGFQVAYVLTGTNNASTAGGSQGRLFGNGGSADAPVNRFAFQELRYYKSEVSNTLFRNYIMNPYQIGESTGNVISDVYDDLYFRAPLGSDGVRFSNGDVVSSIHPRVSGSHASFQADSFSGGSTYTIADGVGTVDFSPNKEFIYFNEPSSGIKK